MSEFNFPKFDLHCHLDGAVAAGTLFRLAKERGIALPADTAEGLAGFVTYGPDYDSVNKYLTLFDLPLAVLQDEAALTTVAYELVKRLDGEGLYYADIRFAPQLHTRKGLTQREAIVAVKRGINRARDEGAKIKIGLIVCAMCIGAADVNRAANIETAKLAGEFHAAGVVNAFDLAGAEGICPLSDFKELFDIANAKGVPLTCHAGDSQGPETVRTAMFEFGSDRIGHGHHIAEDEQLCREAAERGTTLEVCITSNVQCKTQPSYKEHPIKRLFETGVHVTINTDNPVIAGVTLDDEYRHAIDDCGFSLDDIIRMNIYSAEASFLSDDEKAEVIEALKSRLSR